MIIGKTVPLKNSGVVKAIIVIIVNNIKK